MLPSGMTKLEGVPDSSAAVPGMAFFAGTGPEGKTCGGCKHRGYKRQSQNGHWNEITNEIVHRVYRVQSCAMFKKLTGGHGTPVDKDNKCCKYFEPKARP